MPHTFRLRRHPHLPVPPTLRATLGEGGIHELTPGVIGANLLAGVAGPWAVSAHGQTLSPLRQREGESGSDGAWSWQVQSGTIQGRWSATFEPEGAVWDFEVQVDEKLIRLSPLAIPLASHMGSLLLPGRESPFDLSDRRAASEWFPLGDGPGAWALNSQGGLLVMALEVNRPFAGVQVDRLSETHWRAALCHADLPAGTMIEGRLALRIVPFNGAMTLERVADAIGTQMRESEVSNQASLDSPSPIPYPLSPIPSLEDDGSLSLELGGQGLRVCVTEEGKPLAEKHVEGISLTTRDITLGEVPVWEVTLRLTPIRPMRALRFEAELRTPCGNPTWHGDATVVIPGNFARCNYHPDHEHGGGPKWGPSPIPVDEPKVHNQDAPGCCNGWTFAGSRLPQVWAAAADRRAKRLCWIGTTPRSVLGENCAGFISPEGGATTLRLATPTTYEPWVPLGYSRMRRQARRDTAEAEADVPLTWTLWVAVQETEDLNAWAPLDRGLYLHVRPSEPTPIKLTLDEAAKICAGAIHDRFYRPEREMLTYSTGPDGQNAPMAFTGMAHSALVMLWAGHEFVEERWQGAGRRVMDTVAKMFLDGPGFPWTSKNIAGGDREIEGFAAGSGEPGYVTMVGFDNLAEALRRERAWGQDHPEWEQALRRCADCWVKNQSREGAYPHWGPDFGPNFSANEFEVTNVEAGVMANMIDVLNLTGDEKYLESAKRAAALYGKHLDDGRLWGGPGDIKALVNSEVPMFMLRGFRRLFEETQEEEHRRLMLVAAAWRHLFQYAHSWPCEVGSPLWRQGWAGLGAESASASNLHTAAYGAINLPDEWALWQITEDEYHLRRCEDLARYTLQQYARFAGDMGMPFAGAGTESWWASDSVWGKGNPWIFTDPGFDLGYMSWVTGWSGYGALWAREAGIRACPRIDTNSHESSV